MKESSEFKVIKFIQEYCKIIYAEIETDPPLLHPIIEAFKRTCFICFYPKICSKHVLESDRVYVENIDPDLVGYHPCCPPIIHVGTLINSRKRSVN
jgi:hypothetical protein